MRIGILLLVSAILPGMGCGHDRSVTPWQSSAPARQERNGPELEAEDEGARVKGSTVSSRISALIANGQFAEAEALIAEGVASGLLSNPMRPGCWSVSLN